MNLGFSSLCNKLPSLLVDKTLTQDRKRYCHLLGQTKSTTWHPVPTSHWSLPQLPLSSAFFQESTLEVNQEIHSCCKHCSIVIIIPTVPDYDIIAWPEHSRWPSLAQQHDQCNHTKWSSFSWQASLMSGYLQSGGKATEKLGKGRVVLSSQFSLV